MCLVTSPLFPYIFENDLQNLSVVVFSDTGRHADTGKLAFVAIILIDDLSLQYVLHTIACSYHKTKRVFRSRIIAAEILEAGEAIGDGNLLAQTLPSEISTEVFLFIVLDSKDFYTSLSTQWNWIIITYYRTLILFAINSSEPKHMSSYGYLEGLIGLNVVYHV